jgi:hypothetical protein
VIEKSMERTGIESATSWLQTTHIVVSLPTFCRTLEGNRASVPFPSDIHAVLCRDKLTPKLPPLAYYADAPSGVTFPSRMSSASNANATATKMRPAENPPWPTLSSIRRVPSSVKLL